MTKFFGQEKGRRGAVEMTVIVLVIISIASFAILLYFLVVKLNPASASNSQACHESLVTSTSGQGIVAGGINCKTDYVCITGGGKCAGMSSSVNFDVNPSNKEEVLNAIAYEMAQCWWTFGAGQLDYQHMTNFVSSGTFGLIGNSGPACGVCAIIEFDPTVQKDLKSGGTLSVGDSCSFSSQCVSGYCDPHVFKCAQGSPNSASSPLTYQDLFDYLATHYTTEGGTNQTYMQYLYNQPSLGAFLQSSNGQSVMEPYIPFDILPFYYDPQPIPLNSQYLIVTGETKDLKAGWFLKPFFIGTNNFTQPQYNYVGGADYCSGNFITQS